MRIDDLTTLIEGIDSISDIQRIQSIVAERKLQLYTLAELDPTSDHAVNLARLNDLIDKEGVLSVDILRSIDDWFDDILYERLALYVQSRHRAKHSRTGLREAIVTWLQERHRRKSR